MTSRSHLIRQLAELANAKITEELAVEQETPCAIQAMNNGYDEVASTSRNTDGMLENYKVILHADNVDVLCCDNDIFDNDDSDLDKDYNPVYETDSTDSSEEDRSNEKFIGENENYDLISEKEMGYGGNNTNNILENNEQDSETPKTSKKRKRNIDKWPRNIRKDNRNKGKEYETHSKKVVAKKSLKTPCNKNCRHKCSFQFTTEQRQEILESFWAIGNNTRQRQYVSSLITEIVPKYRYPKENSKRTINQAYSLLINNKNVRVCKKFLMATLDIGDTMIRTTLKKRGDNNIVEEDKRGKHNNQRKLDVSLKNGVRQHIDSIPRVESHYLRNQTTREYFEGDLNLATLYRLYKTKCETENVPVVKRCIYEEIFNTEYNIGWHKPKKDQCSTCETYKNSSDDEKQLLEENFQKHIKDKTLSREEKNKDVDEAKRNQNKIVAVYDLQAVLPTPCREVSSFCYKSKLATYNFTIYDIVPKQGHCFVWSEAKRGSNEVATFVFKFLQDHCLKKNVTFYSDNCCGQNKNKYIVAMYMFAVSNFDIQAITHKFLIKGHTQNEGDSMHSCIEREKKRVLKGGPIYIPAQWIPIIRLSKKNNKPYFVNELDTKDNQDFKQLASDFGCNYVKNVLNEKVNFTNIKVLHFKKETPFSFYYKYDYETTSFGEVDVRSKRNNRSQLSATSYTLKPAYKQPPKIPQEKKDGLLYLCRTKAIKEKYHHYFENLKATSSSD